MSVYELSPDQQLRLREWMRAKGWSEEAIHILVTSPTWKTMRVWDQMCDEEGANDG